ncbi:hypothetical protein PYCC9005_004525 [Savitreella phatthalungensis]
MEERSCCCHSHGGSAGSLGGIRQTLDEIEFSSPVLSLHKLLSIDAGDAQLDRWLGRGPSSSRGGALWKTDSSGWFPVLYCRSARTFRWLCRAGLLKEQHVPAILQPHPLAQAVTPEGRKSLAHRAAASGDGELLAEILTQAKPYAAQLLDQLDADGETPRQLAKRRGVQDSTF